jgi:hypothetical protein
MGRDALVAPVVRIPRRAEILNVGHGRMLNFPEISSSGVEHYRVFKKKHVIIPILRQLIQSTFYTRSCL